MSSTFDIFFHFQKEEGEEEKSNQTIKDSVIEDVFGTCVCTIYTHYTRIYFTMWSPNIQSNVTQKTSFLSTAFQSSAFNGLKAFSSTSN